MRYCLIGLKLLVFASIGQAQNCFPNDKLPAHITQLTDFGQRAEWSIDHRFIYFLDKPGGEVWSYNLLKKSLQQMTFSKDRTSGFGYYRVLSLSTGDLLLCGGMERHKLSFEVWERPFNKEPIKIEGENLDEGPAVSRKSMKIAWTSPGQEKIYTGIISFKKSGISIRERELLVDSKQVIDQEGNSYQDIIESQNWRGKNEKELIFAQYSRGSAFRSEVMGIDLKTKKIINYSKAPASYEEPEGIYPDGRSTLVESDLHQITSGTSTIDIYKLELDGSGKKMERLTFFSDEPGFRSSNPVLSDDARFMVFQGSKAGSQAGDGCGLYLFDFRKYTKNKKGL
jgi:hypothetical protein